MVEGKNKRKKFHDKDKYYKLAKEQGLRSRAAFKLSQINRQYPVLQKAKTVLDLCAAPGGWTQVAARTCPQSTQIIAVDILPIRPFPNHRNITTIVGDITTDKCKADIRRALQDIGNSNNNKNAGIELVLHDGAPNVGGAYEKDAYEQNEIAVHALRCATQHLMRKGTFVTKIYRSRDYASYLWVVNQLFGSVNVLKPKASRSQSAEIFLICQDYYKPDKIDPRLLDPKHVFEHVEGDTTNASSSNNKTQATATWNVFHKSWDKAKRQRDGYDTEHFDATMRHTRPVADFIEAPGMSDAIQLMSVCTGFSFQCSECQGKPKDASCHCRFYLNHPLTSQEVRECITDLKVLNKSDFRGLLTWREKICKAMELQKEKEESDDEDSDSDSDSQSDGNDEDVDSEQEEAQVQDEISALRAKKIRQKKKLLKKDRKKAAKRRQQAALGMDLNAIDIQEHEQMFSLSVLKSKDDLEAVAEINIDKSTDDQVQGGNSSDEEDDQDLEQTTEKDEDTGYSYRLDRELDEAYERYLSNTKSRVSKSGTVMAKRSKKAERNHLTMEQDEDNELTSGALVGGDAAAYARMLQGGNASDDDSDSASDEDDDDGFTAEPMTPSEHQKAVSSKKRKKEVSSEKNPLLYELPEEAASLKTARWFSNPLFSSIGQAAQSAIEDQKLDKKTKKQKTAHESDDDSNDAPQVASKAVGIDADQVLASMPLTDKQKRHEKRLKAKARDERRQKRIARRRGEDEAGFEMAPADVSDDEESDYDENIDEAKKQKLKEARRLIKLGLGSADTSKGDDNKFEVVRGDTHLPVLDDRKYDSDHQEYDSDDYVETLALGTMMLRHSKAKQLVDASYNRYAWNDPSDLPEWFVDDEKKHYRPQLPIPPALLEKIRQKQMSLAAKPIAKVAEARARKNKKAKLKLAAAKKKAEAVANSADMTETMKLKAISKALRSQDSSRPGKTYVVAKKGLANKGGKGVKVVDKRMKNDKRSMERAMKKRKSGKQGGLTGSKSDEITSSFLRVI